MRALAGTYEQAFARLREFSPLMLLFLGSSLGNFDRSDTAAFLERVADSLSAGDHLLLGLDLVKDPAALEAAYNDAAGVSAAFTRNLFARMNRELGTDLDLDAIEHVAYWNESRERIDIFARFTRQAVIELPELDRSFRLAAGEMVLTEVSRKFRIPEMTAAAARHGFEAVETFTDPDQAFALLLLRRRPATPAPSTRLVAQQLLGHARAPHARAGRAAHRGAAHAPAQHPHEPDRLGPRPHRELRGAVGPSRARSRRPPRRRGSAARSPVRRRGASAARRAPACRC